MTSNYLLVLLFIGSLCVSSNASPLEKTSINSASENASLYSAKPVSLHKIAEYPASHEGVAKEILVRDTHVILLSNQVITLLERTPSGLALRDTMRINAEGLGMGGGGIFPADMTGEYIASDSGKTLLVDSMIEKRTDKATKIIKVSPDWTLQQLSTVSYTTCGNYVTSENSSVYGCGGNNIIRIIKMTDNGTKILGTINESSKWLNHRLFINENKLTAIYRHYDSNKISLFKFENGTTMETDSLQLPDDSSILFYDTDTDKIYFTIGKYKQRADKILNIDSSNGKFTNIESISEPVFKFESDIYSVYPCTIQGDIVSLKVQISSSVTPLVFPRYFIRDGSNFKPISESPPFNSSIKENNYQHSGLFRIHQNSSSQIELWQNNYFQLKQYNLSENRFETIQERTIVERGLINFPGIQSSDHKYLAQETAGTNFVTISKFNNTTNQLELVLSIPRPTESYIQLRHFQAVGDNKYILTTNEFYLTIYQDNNDIFKSTPPQHLKEYSVNSLSTFIDGYLAYYTSQNGKNKLYAYKFIDNNLTAVDEKETSSLGLDSIYSLMILNNKHYTLLPQQGKAAIVKIVDGKISAEMFSMPVWKENYSPKYFQGKNRVFYSEGTLIADETNNLKIIPGNTPGIITLYKNRINFGAYGSSVFSSINNEWQKFLAQGELGGYYPSYGLIDDNMLVVASKLDLSYDNTEPLKRPVPNTINLYRINSAPYLEKTIAPLNLNQGVETDIPLTTYVSDDEQTDLKFTGLTNSDFSLTNNKVLKYKGLSKESGSLQVTVDDGELQAELSLAYLVNAAPIASQTNRPIEIYRDVALQQNVGIWFTDPEGDALSFHASPQAGLTLSSEGVLSGIPRHSGDLNFAFEVKDAKGALLKTSVTIRSIVNTAPALVAKTPLTAKVGVEFSVDLRTLITDEQQHTYSVTAQNLPAGLRLNDFILSGIPTQAGSTTIQLTATDQLTASSQLALVINIAAADQQPESKSGGAWALLTLSLLLLRVYRQGYRY